MRKIIGVVLLCMLMFYSGIVVRQYVYSKSYERTYVEIQVNRTGNKVMVEALLLPNTLVRSDVGNELVITVRRGDSTHNIITNGFIM